MFGYNGKETEARTKSYLPFTVRYWRHGWRFPSCGCRLYSLPLCHLVRSECVLWSFGTNVYFLLYILVRFMTSMCKKKKVKCTPVQALRLSTGRAAYRGGGRGIALPFLDHGTRRVSKVSVTPRPLFTPEKNPVPIVRCIVLIAFPQQQWLHEHASILRSTYTTCVAGI